VCVCMCVFVCICVRMLVHVCISRLRVKKAMHLHMCMCVCVRVCERENLGNVYPIFVCVFMQVTDDLRAKKAVSDQLHTCIHEYIHTHVHTYAYTHTYICAGCQRSTCEESGVRSDGAGHECGWNKGTRV
jgi:hypothetical protein